MATVVPHSRAPVCDADDVCKKAKSSKLVLGPRRQRRRGWSPKRRLRNTSSRRWAPRRRSKRPTGRRRLKSERSDEKCAASASPKTAFRTCAGFGLAPVREYEYRQRRKFLTPFNAVRCCRRGLTLPILGQGTARISAPGQNIMSATIRAADWAPCGGRVIGVRAGGNAENRPRAPMPRPQVEELQALRPARNGPDGRRAEVLLQGLQEAFFRESRAGRHGVRPKRSRRHWTCPAGSSAAGRPRTACAARVGDETTPSHDTIRRGPAHSCRGWRVRVRVGAVRFAELEHGPPPHEDAKGRALPAHGRTTMPAPCWPRHGRHEGGRRCRFGCLEAKRRAGGGAARPTSC